MLLILLLNEQAWQYSGPFYMQ